MLGITRAAHWWSICMGLLLAGASGSALAADNMYFHGALVAEPCTLRPGDEDIRLDFGSVIDKYLYTYGRTPGRRSIWCCRIAISAWENGEGHLYRC